jgi:hypothetical protein
LINEVIKERLWGAKPWKRKEMVLSQRGEECNLSKINKRKTVYKLKTDNRKKNLEKATSGYPLDHLFCKMISSNIKWLCFIWFLKILKHPSRHIIKWAMRIISLVFFCIVISEIIIIKLVGIPIMKSKNKVWIIMSD